MLFVVYATSVWSGMIWLFRFGYLSVTCVVLLLVLLVICFDLLIDVALLALLLLFVWIMLWCWLCLIVFVGGLVGACELLSCCLVELCFGCSVCSSEFWQLVMDYLAGWLFCFYFGLRFVGLFVYDVCWFRVVD